MKNIIIILSKELKTYFASPMAYIVAAAYLAITGFFFVASVSDAFSEASIRGYLAGATFFMIFMSPAITMRLIAEEQKLGTLELLLTSPIKEAEVVIGKFLAAFITVIIMIILSMYFVIILYIFGDPDTGPLFNGLLGLLLYASSTLAIGLFASALSPHQIVGLVVGSGILTALTIVVLTIFIFIVFFSLKRALAKKQAQKEEHEKIKAYGESINEETRNKNK